MKIICKNCKEEKQHHAKGFCCQCYEKWRWRTNEKRRLHNKQNWEQNKEKYLKQQKQYYHSHRSQILQQKKEYNLKTKENRTMVGKQYRIKNKEKINEYHKLYCKKNRDKCRRWEDSLLRKFRSNIRHNTTGKYGPAKQCLICGDIGKVKHHHYTEPYHRDYFVDLCEECHKGVEDGMGLISLWRMIS